MNRYTARLLVGDACSSIPLYGLHSPIISPSREWAVPKRTVGEWVRFDVMASLFFQCAWFLSTLRPFRTRHSAHGTPHTSSPSRCHNGRGPRLTPPHIFLHT